MRKFLISLIALATIPAFAPPIGFRDNPIPGLVGFWTMDASSGIDKIGTNNLLNVGTPTWTNGVAGNAVRFNGDVANYLNLATPSGFPTGSVPRTLAAFFNCAQANTGVGEEVVGYGSNNTGRRFGIFLQNTTILIECASVALGGAWTVSAGWHHACITYSGGALNTGGKIYLDGTLLVTNSATAATTTLVTDINNIAIGTIPTVPGNNMFTGAVDTVTLYNRVLSAEEVKTLYNGGKGRHQ